MSKELIERLRNTTYHNLDPYEAADRIEQLEAEVERLATKVVKQKKELDDFDNVIDDMSIAVSCINPLEDLKRAIANIKEKLAASQAREQQLRDALSSAEYALDECRDYPLTYSDVIEALALPSDTTALEAMIAKAGEAMRERCACIRYDEKLEKAIRAFPGVTLEDLK